jgi:FkbM family methyltransferase
LKHFSHLENPVIFDIGGNKGEWADAARGSFSNSRIFVFEPSNESFKALIQRFKGMDSVVLVNNALGKEAGRLPLYADISGSPLSSLLNRNLDFANLNFSFKEEVEVVNLDDWCREQKVTPDILKLDIEGFELKALQGFLRNIEKVKLIQFEFGGANRDSQTYFKDFWDFFAKRNFLLFRISPLGLIPIKQYQESQEVFRTTNYIAVNELGS